MEISFCPTAVKSETVGMYVQERTAVRETSVFTTMCAKIPQLIQQITFQKYIWSEKACLVLLWMTLHFELSAAAAPCKPYFFPHLIALKATTTVLFHVELFVVAFISCRIYCLFSLFSNYIILMTPMITLSLPEHFIISWWMKRRLIMF